MSAAGPQRIRFPAAGQPSTIKTKPIDPIGLTDQTIDARTHIVASSAGDELVVYTDGVVETARDRKRFMNLALEGLSDMVGPSLRTITAAADEIAKGNHIPDDFTLLPLRFAPSQSAPDA